MLGSAETKGVREFVKRHCALTVEPDGQQKCAEGYFRFDGGRTSKEARKACAKVDWGEPEPTCELVLQRVNMLSTEGHARIYIRAIGHADSYAVDSLTVEGDPEAPLEVSADPKGAHSVNEAVAAVMIGQQRSIDRLVERLERVSEERQEQMVNAGLYMLAAQGSQDNGKLRALEQSLTVLAPVLERTVPMLVAAWLGIPGGAPPVPPLDPGADPAAVVDHSIVELDALFARMAGVFATHPSLLTAERMGRITSILARYGGGRNAADGGNPPPQDQANNPSTPPPGEPSTETAG